MLSVAIFWGKSQKGEFKKYSYNIATRGELAVSTSNNPEISYRENSQKLKFYLLTHTSG